LKNSSKEPFQNPNLPEATEQYTGKGFRKPSSPLPRAKRGIAPASSNAAEEKRGETEKTEKTERDE
jgi:hypothetical protein